MSELDASNIQANNAPVIRNNINYFNITKLPKFPINFQINKL